MTTDIQTAARALMQAAERARRDELVSIEEQRIVCRAIVQGYDEARERLAQLDAEYARVEAQSTADVARQALEPVREGEVGTARHLPYRCAACGKVWSLNIEEGRLCYCPTCGSGMHAVAQKPVPKCDGDHKGPLCADKQCWLRCPDCGKGEHYPAACALQEQPKPEPHRAGLPPERLRKVWAEWDVQERGGPADLPLEFSQDGRLCRWADGKEWFAVIETSAIWDGRTFRPHGATWARVEEMADEAERALPRPVANCGQVAADGTCGHPNALTPECHDGVVCSVKAEKQAEPTLLDLTKLPPGTVCEATENGFFAKGWRYRILGHLGGLVRVSTVEWGGEGEVLIDPMQPARVVKEGGEDAQG